MWAFPPSIYSKSAVFMVRELVQVQEWTDYGKTLIQAQIRILKNSAHKAEKVGLWWQNCSTYQFDDS